MKKCNFLVVLLALVGFATSCSQDDSLNLQNSENNRVVMNVGFDAETLASLKSGPVTRSASGDLQLAGYSLRYILEVWNENNAVAYHKEKLVTDASQTIAFEFSLPDAGDYDALLWADYVSDDAALTDEHYADLYYTTNDAVNGLKAISLIGSAYTVNTASRDAFFGKASFTKTADAPIDAGSVTLTRPFGRINIIEKNADMLTGLTSINLTYAVPLNFNVLDGTVSSTYPVTINETSFPDAASERANIFYDYVFAPSTGQELLGEIKIDYTLNGENGTFTIPANMPVERNKRTNISGSILSAPVDPQAANISVEIDNTWTDSDFEFDAPAVGSYYYEGGLFSNQYISALTCLGVVFHVDGTGKHGLIVSLDQTTAQWSTVEKHTLAASEEQPETNSFRIKEGNINWENEYPSFKWSEDKGSGWYLPVILQLKLLADNTNVVNTALESAGAELLDFTSPYWSSEEINIGHSIAYPGDQYEVQGYPKSTVHQVRSVKAF